MLTIGQIAVLGADEAVLQASNDKGLVIAEEAAFAELFPGVSLGAPQEYYARGTRLIIATLGAGVDPNLIWKARADR